MQLFYDYDSTLNNLTIDWITWINHEFGMDLTIGDVDTWEWFYDMEKNNQVAVFQWFKDMIPYDITKPFSTRPIDGAIDFVNDSRAKTQHKITVLTATHCHSLIDLKDKHIEHFFGDVNVKHTDKKHHYAYNYEKNIANILLDDKPQSCIDWVKNGGIAMLFTNNKQYTYTKTDFEHPSLYRTDSYEDALALVDQVANNIKKMPVPEGKMVTCSVYLEKMEEGDIAYHSDYVDNETRDKYTFIKLEGNRFSVLSHDDGKIHEYDSVHRVMDDFVHLGLEWDIASRTRAKNENKRQENKTELSQIKNKGGLSA